MGFCPDRYYYFTNTKMGNFFIRLELIQDLEKSFASKFEYRCADAQIQCLDKMLPEWKADEMPVWWTKYNKTKHSLPDGYKEGNLQNTCFALAGLYALHELANHLAYSGKDKTFLHPEKWWPTFPRVKYIKGIPIIKEHARQSKLFRYLHQPT